MPIDFRLIDLLLRASKDPEVALATIAEGVRVGPGARLPRLPALYPKKRKWRLPEQDRQSRRAVQLGYSVASELRVHSGALRACRRRSRRAARSSSLKIGRRDPTIPNLVVASLGAARKDKPKEVVTTRWTNWGTSPSPYGHVAGLVPRWKT